MNDLYIKNCVLTFQEHITVANALAILQQQLESFKNYTVVKKQVQIIIDTCIYKFDRDSKVIKTLKLWNKKSIKKRYLQFKIALADDFKGVSDEDYARFGDIYYCLENRYLSKKQFNNSNSSISGWD